MKLFKFTCGLDDKYGAAEGEQDAYERRAEVDQNFHHLPVEIEEVKVDGYAVLITSENAVSVTQTLREMLGVQGGSGNWNYDPYMHGMYNGMELMLSVVENREPVYRDAPESWLSDKEPVIDHDPIATQTKPPDFEDMDKDALRAWLDERKVEYVPQWGDKRLREVCRETLKLEGDVEE